VLALNRIEYEYDYDSIAQSLIRDRLDSAMRKVLIWIGIGMMAVVAVSLIAVALLNWTANRRLADQIASLRSSGEPVSLADLESEPPPPEENARTYLGRVERQVSAIQSALVVVMNDSQYRETGHLNAAGAQLVRAAFEKHSQVLPELEQAAIRAQYDPSYDFSVAPPVVLNAVLQSVTQLRGVTRVILLRAAQELFDGRRDEALRLAVLALRLTRQAEREPFVIGYTSSLASRSAILERINQILADGPVSPELRLSLEEELARHDGMEGFVWAIRSERALGTTQFAHFFGTIPFWRFTNSTTEYLAMMAAELEFGSAPSHLFARARAESPYSPLNRHVYVSVQECRTAMDRVRAAERCLYVLSRCETQAMETAAETLPLEALGLEDKFTTDPFTGQRLRTSLTPEGWIIYSVGRNAKDDGGRDQAPADDIRAGPWPGEGGRRAERGPSG
jgi:hypothetical protein